MIRTAFLATTLAVTFASADAAPLQMKIYSGDGTSFNVTSTLIYGEKEALVIDTGFTRGDALRIAANVLDSGKQLKTIFVSQADPDFYFGVETLKEIFPQAEVLATPEVLAKIRANVAGKVAFWGPKMGANAPRVPVMPTELKGSTLKVDGETLEVRGTQGILAHRPYVWIPSLKAIVGNIGIFGNVHVWTADTQTAVQRSAWMAQLDEMAALKPEVVVPGHMQANTPINGSAIGYTRTYLQTFEQNAKVATNSAELIASMKKAYPDAQLGVALDIGAKVNKGEMKW